MKSDDIDQEQFAVQPFPHTSVELINTEEWTFAKTYPETSHPVERQSLSTSNRRLSKAVLPVLALAFAGKMSGDAFFKNAEGCAR